MTGTDEHIQQPSCTSLLSCRFCLLEGEVPSRCNDTNPNPLISPCECKGSLQYVHLNCLTRWQDSVLQSALLQDMTVTTSQGNTGAGRTAIAVAEWPPMHTFSLLKVIQCPLCNAMYTHSYFHPYTTTPADNENNNINHTLFRWYTHIFSYIIPQRVTNSIYWRLTWCAYSRLSYQLYHYMYSMIPTSMTVSYTNQIGYWLLYGILCVLVLPIKFLQGSTISRTSYQSTNSSGTEVRSSRTSSVSSGISSFQNCISHHFHEWILNSIEYFYPSFCPIPSTLEPLLSPSAIHRGVFLVADPSLPCDSPYYRSIVLLYAHRQVANGKLAESRGVFINKEDPQQPQVSVMNPNICCGYGGHVRDDMAVSVVLHNNSTLYQRCEHNTHKLHINSNYANGIESSGILLEEEAAHSKREIVIVNELDQAYIALHHLTNNNSGRTPNKQTKRTPVHILRGYCQWYSSSLEREIQAGLWHIVPASENAIFHLPYSYHGLLDPRESGSTCPEQLGDALWLDAVQRLSTS